MQTENSTQKELLPRSNIEIRLDCFTLATDIIAQDEIGNVDSIFVLAEKIYNWISNAK